MLAATLLLAPDQIVYHVLFTLPSECLVQRAALPPLNVSACWAGLGVRFHRINVSDASAPFVRDALGASMARTLHDAGRSFSRVILADFARVYALLEHGGYYTDSDVFVTSANLTRWRRCPFVMSGNTGDAYDVAAGEGRAPVGARRRRRSGHQRAAQLRCAGGGAADAVWRRVAPRDAQPAAEREAAVQRPRLGRCRDGAQPLLALAAYLRRAPPGLASRHAGAADRAVDAAALPRVVEYVGGPRGDPQAAAAAPRVRGDGGRVARAARPHRGARRHARPPLCQPRSRSRARSSRPLQCARPRG